MRLLRVRPQAHKDVLAAADYYFAEANLDIAFRFVAAVEDTYSRLLEHPHIGTEVKTFKPRLAGLRLWPVPTFESYLVFYLAGPDALDIVRVLHGARNLPGELGGPPTH